MQQSARAARCSNRRVHQNGGIPLNTCTLGIDYGTNSVRALLVQTASGEPVATSTWNYAHGDAGIILDPQDPDVARQHPDDYIEGLKQTVRAVVAEAGEKGIGPDAIIGIGVDTTGSTPIPVDADGEPLTHDPAFKEDPAAMAWLWKDHTAHAEAAEFTALAGEHRPGYLAKCGGTYSSEWFWAKVLRCRRSAPHVFEAAHTWVEIADWIPALLTGTTHPDQVRRCICAAGHKAAFHPDWGGYPDAEFLALLDPALADLRQTLPDTACTIGDAVGTLTESWAQALGLRAGIPVAGGAFDAHLGAVGSGVRPGVLVKILGTSCCDMTVAPLSADLPDIPGLCGIVPESILPGNHGLEAGQSAVGDIFNWFVNRIAPGGSEAGSHEGLTEAAAGLRPGESGLLALDWHNGNRTVLVDQRLSGTLVGMNLHTSPGEIYRALIEATAFGARVIMERFEEYGVTIERVVNCGGISIKNPLVMQIYADIMNRPLEISRSSETCALGAAMAGAVVAGPDAGGHADFDAAAQAMTGVMDTVFTPIPENAAVYERLYRLYRQLHDTFGTSPGPGDAQNIMKDLLAIRDEVKGGS